ncbi:hypothetical protein [Cupriavidus campinensis]|uniref:Uncharacterized protein n=1 Tax=Cupriavidus campinensis TaxID=151783 RepID=A0ABY3ESQ9_9BURK|nr:hypothetical protein [Cupriavidus campinensis]TSP14008.1 hypothetical protein FGG12_05925 [Cupriavidus campinensis]
MASSIMDLMKPGFTTGDPFDAAEMRRQREQREGIKSSITMETFVKKAAEMDRAQREKWEKPLKEKEAASASETLKWMAKEVQREKEERARNLAERQKGINVLNDFINRMAPLVGNPHAYLRENEQIPESANTPEKVFKAAVDEDLLDTMILEHAAIMKPENMKTGDRTKDLHLEALQALADELTFIGSGRLVVGSLSGPVRLSVVGKDGRRGVANMIGGEEFRLIGAHIANSTGALWLHMKPVSPEKFDYAEVSLEFAKEGHFGMLFDRLESAVEGGIVKRCKALAEIRMAEREQREMAERQTQYADFGSW